MAKRFGIRSWKTVGTLKLCSSVPMRGWGCSISRPTPFLFESTPERCRKIDSHSAGIPAIGWMYPRGKWVTEKYGKDSDPEIVAYGARVGLEVGADMVKIKYTGDVESFRKVVQAAGKTKVVLSGGEKTEKLEEFLQVVKDVMVAGAAGVAVGRNVWKSEKPLEVTEKVKEIIFK